MSTPLLRVGVMGFAVGMVGLGCNGQTYIGTPGGSGGAIGGGMGGATMSVGGVLIDGGAGGSVITVDASIGDSIIITGNPTTGMPTDAAPTTTDAYLADAVSTLPDATESTPDAPPSTCPVAGEANTPTTVDAMRAALVGDWIQCSSLGLFRKPQIGIRITADDRWAFLERDPVTNAIAPATGVDFEGSMQYEALSGHVQVNFESDLMFTIISAPVISKSPTVLIINNEGVDEYRYVLPDGL